MDVDPEGKDVYELAHEVAEVCLMEFGKPFGVSKLLTRAPKVRQEIWHNLGIEPRAIDREIATVMHSTHIGCCADLEAISSYVYEMFYGRWLGWIYDRYYDI